MTEAATPAAPVPPRRGGSPGLLSGTFGSEDNARRFIASNDACLREILREADFSEPFRQVGHFQLKFGGKPDIILDVEGRGIVFVELALRLDPDHVHGDFKYVLDPAATNRLAAMIWVCDSYASTCPEMLDFYIRLLRLWGTKTFALLTLRHLSVPEARFRFDRLLFGTRRGVATADGGDLRRELLARASPSGRVDTTAVAKAFGMSHGWVTERISRTRGGKRSPLLPMRNRDGAFLTGPNGVHWYRVEDVIRFIAESESWVADEKGIEPIPLVSAMDKRILDGQLLTLTACQKALQEHVSDGKLRRVLGTPAAVCFSTSGNGYSLLYPNENTDRLKPAQT